jgi:hypothetical protein
LLVMLVIIAVAIAGTSAVAISNGEAGTAGARSMRANALAAAEAGLAHFNRTATPTRMDDGWYLGGDDEWFWLPSTKSATGETMEARYRVRGEGPGPIPSTGLAIVEGQVLAGGNVVGRTEIAVILMSESRFGDAGTHQEDLNQTGSSADLPGYTTRPVSLERLP